MSLATALLTPILGDASPWTPQRLFVLGEAGGVYDPANLTAEKVAWALANPGFTSAQFLAAFPTHALYQEAAGTTPVTALGQPVGLVIDSKTGGLANLGPELVDIAALPTPTIANLTGAIGTWTAGTRTMANTAVGTDSAYPRFSFDFGLVSGKRYLVKGRLSGDLGFVATAGTTGVRMAISGSSNNLSFNASTGLFYGVQVAGSNVLQFLLNGTLALPQSVVIEELSIREVPGVHAIQATSSSRPLLDGRVNLLTFSEQFGNAAWVKSTTTVSANAALAPDGTTTADLVYPASSGSFRSIYQTFTGANNQQSFYAKASGLSWVALIDHTGSANCAWFNIAAGTVGTVAAGYTATIEAAPNGYFRCTAVRVSGNFLGLIQITPTDGDAINTVTASGTNGVLLWGADARLASEAAYPYQRVAAATDYADVGVPRSFLFDGFDDSLYTASNMDLSGTDKVTVLAGVRKLSDAAVGIVAETSATSATNPGTIAVFAPTSAATNFLWRTIGSPGGAGATDAQASYPAPTTRVVTGLGEIATDTCILRVDGAQVASSSGDQGTGNYVSYVLNIGRRNNATLPLNGKLYQLIVRGALTDAATLAQAERYVGARTGIFI